MHLERGRKELGLKWLTDKVQNEYMCTCYSIELSLSILSAIWNLIENNTFVLPSSLVLIFITIFFNIITFI